MSESGETNCFFMVCNERNVKTKWHNPADLDFKIHELQTLFSDNHHVLHVLCTDSCPWYLCFARIDMAYQNIKYNLSPVTQLDALSVNTFDCLQGGQESKGWLAPQYTYQPRLVSRYAVNWSLECNDWITVLKTGL